VSTVVANAGRKLEPVHRCMATDVRIVREGGAGCGQDQN
jgi:hypothetical protein